MIVHNTLVGALVFLTVALLVAPRAPQRRTVHGLVRRAVAAALVLVVGACLLFHCVPAAVPPALDVRLDPFLQDLQKHVPGLQFLREHTSVWLLLAALAAGAAWPWLAGRAADPPDEPDDAARPDRPRLVKDILHEAP